MYIFHRECSQCKQHTLQISLKERRGGRSAPADWCRAEWWCNLHSAAAAGLTSASQRSSGGGGLCRHQPPRPRPRPLLMLPAFSSVVRWWSQAPGTATTSSSLPDLIRRILCPRSSIPNIWTGAKIVKTTTESEPVVGARLSSDVSVAAAPAPGL